MKRGRQRDLKKIGHRIMALMLAAAFWSAGPTAVFAIDPLLSPTQPNQPTVSPFIEIAPGQTVTYVGQALTDEPISRNNHPLEKAQLAISHPVVRGVDLGLVVTLRLKKSSKNGIVKGANVVFNVNGAQENVALRCGNKRCTASIRRPEAPEAIANQTISFTLPTGTRSKTFLVRLQGNSPQPGSATGTNTGLVPEGPLDDPDIEPILPKPPCTNCELVQSRTIADSFGVQAMENVYRFANDATSLYRQVQTVFFRNGQQIGEILTTPPLAYNAYTFEVDRGAAGFTSNVILGPEYGLVTESNNIHVINLQTGAQYVVNINAEIIRMGLQNLTQQNISFNEVRSYAVMIDRVSPNHVVMRLELLFARSLTRAVVDVLIFTGNNRFDPITAVPVMVHAVTRVWTQPPVTRADIDRECGHGYVIHEGADPCLDHLVQMVRAHGRIVEQFFDWSHPSYLNRDLSQSPAWNIGTLVNLTGYSRYAYMTRYQRITMAPLYGPAPSLGAYCSSGNGIDVSCLNQVDIFDRENGNLQTGIRWYSVPVASQPQSFWLPLNGSFIGNWAGFFDISEDPATGNVTIRTYYRLTPLMGRIPRWIRAPAIEAGYVLSPQRSTPYATYPNWVFTASWTGTTIIGLPTAAPSGSARITI